MIPEDEVAIYLTDHYDTAGDDIASVVIREQHKIRRWRSRGRSVQSIADALAFEHSWTRKGHG